MGIGVEAVQHEYTHGQLEINLAHQRGLRAADDGFQFKTSVKEILARRGYLATFMAKPMNTGNANGCHVHVSLLDGDGHNLLDDPAAEHGVSQAFWHFLAGQLEHAAGMMALTSPTLNCYKRLVPNRFAPLAATWGWEDRTMLIRIPMQRGPATHLENRIASAAGNPYLVTAAILAAGLDGIRRKAPVPDRQNAPPLPRSMPEALDALQADTVMVRTFGEQFVRDYVAIKMMEVERARTYVTDWDRQEYMEML
jgi:glutamine synthetase